jgi:HAD superfamily hydrolase (TIGR01509 family)
MTINAVVFDLDGVLIDSEPVWEEIRRAFVSERRGQWQPDTQKRLMGMSTAEWSRYVSVELGVGMATDEVAEEVIRRMAERYSQALPLLHGAVEAVRRLARRWRLGLASSSPTKLIEAVLGRAGLAEDFEIAISTEDVAHGKPSPDVYLAVATRLEVPCDQCAAIEDSNNGLRSARAAGMRVIALPRPEYPPEPEALAGADLALQSLEQLTVETIEALG